MWGQKGSGESQHYSLCSGCGKTISDIVFQAPNGGSYCQKCAIKTPVNPSPAIQVPARNEPAKPHRITRKTKVIVALVAAPVVLVVGIAALIVFYTFSTPELVMSAGAGDTAGVAALLARGADVNATSLNKTTALHFAALAGNIKMVAALLRYSPNLECRNRQSETPLMLAASFGHADIVRILLARHADPNAKTDEGMTALHAAALHGDLLAVQSLLAYGADVNAQTRRHACPLHAAAQEGHAEVIEALLAHGANIDAKSTGGDSPLYVAAANGKTESARVLLKYQADLEGRNAKGRTPLMGAADFGRDDVVRLLLASGANVNATDRDGRTARELARIANRGQVLRALDGKTASEKPMERYAQPYGAFVEMEPQSGWSLLLDKFSFLLALVLFPRMARFLEPQKRTGRRAALWCYFRTAGICVSGALLLSVIGVITSFMLGFPLSLDGRAVRSFWGIVVGGLVSLWLASRSKTAQRPSGT